MVWYNPYTWFQKSVASILSSLHNLVAELEDHSNTQASLAWFHQDKVDTHKALSDVAIAESKAADAVATQVKTLITPVSDTAVNVTHTD